MNTTQEEFLKDLNQFIINHPHYKANEGSVNDYPEEDETEYVIHDVDGDYEKVQIKVIGIA
jgi:hypothetical protein